jgi:esterase/lipase
VDILLLPGHGTIPGDLLSVHYQDWIRASEFGISQLSKNAREIYLGGHSLGGAIAIYETL